MTHMTKRNKLVVILYFLILSSVLGYGFQARKPVPPSQVTSNFVLPLEHIYLHINTTFLLPGETLYYKAYTINAHTRKRSNLSKVLYIVLVNENFEPVFKHKVLLKNGEGQGDHFIPSGLPSGNYKLIAFTQLTNSKGVEYAYQQDITIVNPYQGNQAALLPSADTLTTAVPIKVETGNSTNENQYYDLTKTYNLPFSVRLSDSVCDKRSRLTLQFRSPASDIQQGSYSISVRKVDAFPIIRRNPFDVLQSEYKTRAQQINLKNSATLPELRGELYQARIKTRNNINHETYDEVVAISIPGESYEAKFLKTDNHGFFWFQRDTYDTRQDQVFFQVLGPNRDKYEMEITPLSDIKPEYNSVHFATFSLSPEMKEMLIDRSIKNQISNSFLSVKQDTIKINPERTSPLESMYDRSYVLDDYNRFPSVSETVVEFIQGLWIGRDKQGNKVFRIRIADESAITRKSDLPLVVVDGLILQDHSLLINYPAAKIEAIHLIQQKYNMGVKTFPGVVEVTTFEGDFFKDISVSYVHKEMVTHPLEPKNYFKQNYSDTLAKIKRRIPDFRRQLFWEPNCHINQLDTSVSFYTSDSTGVFELEVQGFTKSGKPLQVTRRFRVR